MNIVQDNITMAIDNVFRELDISFVDDSTYKELENIGAHYEYIDNDLFEQMIEAEFIMMLDRDSSTDFYLD